MIRATQRDHAIFEQLTGRDAKPVGNFLLLFGGNVENQPHRARPELADDALFEIGVVDAEVLQLIRRRQMQRPRPAGPFATKLSQAIAGGRMYVRTVGHLLSVGGK